MTASKHTRRAPEPGSRLDDESQSRAARPLCCRVARSTAPSELSDRRRAYQYLLVGCVYVFVHEDIAAVSSQRHSFSPKKASLCTHHPTTVPDRLAAAWPESISRPPPSAALTGPLVPLRAASMRPRWCTALRRNLPRRLLSGILFLIYHAEIALVSTKPQPDTHIRKTHTRTPLTRHLIQSPPPSAFLPRNDFGFSSRSSPSL